MNIKIEISARHVHLSDEDFKKLFGNNSKLTEKKSLSQPGEFLSVEKINIVGPRNTMYNVSIIGPVRKNTQVEISMTDARVLGIDAPIRESGHINNTPGCEIIGPKGKIEINGGVIVAKRHLHLKSEDARKKGIKNGELVAVKVKTEDRSLIFEDVVARVTDKFAPAMHIDTDEANAAGIKGAIEGTILNINSKGT